MRRWRWTTQVGVWLLAACLAVACGACGSSGSTFGDGDGGRNDGQGGPPLHHDGGSRDVTMRLSTTEDAGMPRGKLSISPENPTLHVTSTSTPTEKLMAELTIEGVAHAETATWTLSSYTLGAISSAGVFTPNGTVAGTVTVTATYGGATATTRLTVDVSLSAQLANVTLPDGTVISEDSSAITPADLTALQGATPAAGDGGAASTLVYPYDRTVFPLGLLAPVAEFHAGSVAPVDFKISLDTTGFHWDGFGHVGNPAALQAAIPQTAWDGALESATSTNPAAGVTLSLVTASAGVAYGPAVSHLVIASGKLTGVIYYESYSTDPIDAGADATDFGLWAVKPGQAQPPAHIEPGCVICHGVSASGNTLTNGTDDTTIGDLTGVFRVEADGGYTHLATAPVTLPYAVGGGIDSRGVGWGTVSPDGKVILRGENQFWGGEALLAWATPAEPLLEGGVLQPLSTTMRVLGDFAMFVPQFSVDGKHLVYVTATSTTDGGPPGAPSQSIGVVDIATSLADGGGATDFGSVTLTNPRLLYDSTKASADGGGGGTLTKVPTFLADSQTIVFEETQGGLTTAAAAGYNGMLPDFTGVDGELAVLQKTPSGSYVRTAMTRANTGVDPITATHNFEPKPLPVSVGGYYWVVFASLRADAYPTVAAPKKLWVTAISPGTTPGQDPSNPPFTLVNQAIVAVQQSQRAYWALSPCLGTGATCQTSSDCCDGSCIPESSTDPASPLVCRVPTAMACVPQGSRCMAGASQDCCNASSGVSCIGTLNGYGTCEAIGAPP